MKRKKMRQRKAILVCILIFVIILIVFAVLVLLKGRSGPKATTDTLTIGEKVTYEELSADTGMTKDEVKEYAGQTIDDFNNEVGEKSVKLEKVSEEETGEIYLKTSYTTVDIYSRFTGYEAFSGTIDEAKAAGYDFDTVFTSVTNGAKGDNADKNTVTSDGQKKVLIIRENATFVVDGDILYVTENATSVSDARTVTVNSAGDSEDAAVLTYIIYEPSEKE